MKILFPIGTLYPSQAGGPSNTVYWLAKSLQKNSIPVTAISTDFEIPPDIRNRWLLTDAGKIFYQKTRFHALPLRMIGRSLAQIPRNEVIHLTSLFYFPSLVLAFFSLVFQKKVVWSVRGELADSALIFNKTIKKGYLFLLKMLAGQITFHSTSPAETAAILQKLAPRKPVVELPNFIELPAALPKNSTEKFLLFMGRIHSIKALENLLEALVASDFFLKNDWRLKIAGTGKSDYVAQLKTLAVRLGLTEKIDWLGPVVGAEKQQLLADARLVSLVSHSENFGAVVIESLAQGTPVLASTGTPWEILETENAGFWTKNDPISLKNELNKLFSIQPADYTAMQKQARRLAENQFDIEKNAFRWVEFYEKLTARA